MHKLVSERLKAVLILIFYLIMVVFWGSSMVISFVEESVNWAIVWIVSSVLVLLGAFWIDFYTKRYKFKYLFLGKKFKAQVRKIFEVKTGLSKKEKRNLLKQMKDTYRRTGSIHFAVYDLMETPNKIWSEDNRAFNYGNALDKQKIEYIIYCLNLNAEIGGGFYRFFESLAEEPMTYDEYAGLVKNSDLFSKALKEVLLSKEHKNVFKCFKKENDLTKDEEDALQKFDENGSNILFDFADEIFKLVEKLSVQNYLDLKKKQGLPENVVRLFMSKDGMKRAYIYFDEQTKTYKANIENFVFYDTDVSPMNSEGNWIGTDGSSYFETQELAFNEIKNAILDLEELI